MTPEKQETKTKRIAKNSLVLYVRLAVLIIVGLYTSRVTLDILGVEDFGIYNLVGGIIVMMNFISNAMALAINRFLSFNIGRGDIKKASEVFSMAVNIHVLLCLAVFVIGETIGLWFVNTHLVIPADRMFAANVVYQTSLISFSLQILSVPYNSDIISHEHMGYFALTSIIQTLGKLLAAISLTLFIDTDKLVTYAILMVLPFVLYFLMNTIYCTRRFEEASYKWIWSKSLFREMSSFAGFSTFGNMATAIVNLGQSVLLNMFFGPALNTVRGLSLQVNAAVQSFAGGIYTAVNPQIIKSYAQGDIDYFNKLVCTSTKIGYFMIFTLSLPMILEIEPILSVWLTEVPDYTSIFVRLILINTLIYNFVTPSWMAFQATGKVAVIHLTTGCINLCNVIITYIMWKNVQTEPYFIIIVNIAVSFIMQLATMILQSRRLPINMRMYGRSVVLSVMLYSICAAIIPIAVYSTMEEGILRFVVTFALSVACSVFAFYRICLDKALKDYVAQYAKTKIGKMTRKTQ